MVAPISIIGHRCLPHEPAKPSVACGGTMSCMVQPDITHLLAAWQAGDSTARDQMFSLVHSELKILARSAKNRSSPQSIQVTELINEAYLRLAEGKELVFQNRLQFFALAGQIMRHILVDLARQKQAIKRGGQESLRTLDENDSGGSVLLDDILGVDSVLQELEQHDVRKAKIVEMKVFAGMTMSEMASILGVTEKTVQRDWHFSKNWLFQRLRQKD